MFCPLCGKPVPPGAAFCPSCGAAQRPAGPTPPGAGRPVDRTGVQPAMPRPVAPPTAMPVSSVAADFDAQRRKQRWIMAGAGLLALVAAFFGLRAAGLLRLGASTGPATVMAPHEAGAPNLQLPAQATPPPILEPATAAAKVTMPDDVRDYLEHVRKCEVAKAKLASDQNAEAMVAAQKLQTLGPAMSMLNGEGVLDPGSDDNKDPAQLGKDTVLNFRGPWEQLVTFFNSKRPPAECVSLASDYNQALGEIGGQMGDLGELLNSAATDPQAALKKANAMQGKSPEAIDKYFGSADDKVGAICAKYDTRKWFDVKKDIGAGGLLGLPGAMGAGGGLGGASVPGG